MPVTPLVASICHRRARNQDEPALLGWRGRRGNADEGRTGPFEHADVAGHSRAGHRAPKPRRFAQPAAPVRVSPSCCKSPTITQSIIHHEKLPFLGSLLMMVAAPKNLEVNYKTF